MTQSPQSPLPDQPNTDWVIESGEVELDFQYQHHRQEHGDLTVMLTWNFYGDVPDAVLVLAPTYHDPLAEEQPRICVIHRNDAWRWSRTHNNEREMIGYWGFNRPPNSDAWQMANATYYAMMLGLDAHESRTAMRIRGLIEDYLGDLVSMPPAPTRANAQSALFEVMDLQTGKTVEAEAWLD